jgi:acyl carrier protein
MTQDGDRESAVDVYVFEAESKKLVVAGSGFCFSRVSQSSLARALEGVNRSSELGQPLRKAVTQKSKKPSIEAFKSSAKRSFSKHTDLFDVFHNVTNIPLEELKDESTLDDLRIDSLMATEVLNDIQSAFSLAVNLTIFLFFLNLRAI